MIQTARTLTSVSIVSQGQISASKSFIHKFLKVKYYKSARRIYCSNTANSMPEFSKRIKSTDAPCIVEMQRMLAGTEDVMSLAQGIVHWAPPAVALNEAMDNVTNPRVHQYAPDIGLPELRSALAQKLKTENGLTKSDVMVTAGANQAFMNVAVTLLDGGGKTVLFSPYYFNHLMALQMTGNPVLVAECDKDFVPDMDKLGAMLQSDADIKAVVLCNPCNPSGIVTPLATLERCAALCKEAGVWLVVDNTYEYFMYDGAEHGCVEGDNIVNMFSFSKAFGMMGWRIGYIAFPQKGPMRDELLKVQDTIPVCAGVLNQLVALSALQDAGKDWVMEHVHSLEENRAIVLDALSPLGADAIAPSNGAIYLWARLPADCIDDKQIVEWLVRKHGVCVIPGSACGVPGYIRIAFANLHKDKCILAAERLKRGLHQLVTDNNL
mmetsp:Transcript_39875/g.55411  ORF Transcript_39875/g.55411 Transcript_39875/m.55411 type:complete len:437 (-) Transcript_39875:114-1424(-)